FVRRFKMEDNKEDVFYIGVKEPGSVRRAALESSRSVVESLQRYERFKTAREQKAAEIVRLQEDVKEINKLLTGLRSALPKTQLKEIIPKKAKKPKANAVKKVEEKPVVKPVVKKLPKPSEVEKLEGELADIERKLGRLG
ncbi:unnamed protein product, partial [marine sediment metagenome]